jgi:hypothetical protein
VDSGAEINERYTSLEMTKLSESTDLHIGAYEPGEEESILDCMYDCFGYRIILTKLQMQELVELPRSTIRLPITRESKTLRSFGSVFLFVSSRLSNEVTMAGLVPRCSKPHRSVFHFLPTSSILFRIL